MKAHYPTRFISLAAVLFLPALSLQAAAPITLPSAPLYLAGGVAPNLVVTLDDSGSMTWGYVPDSMGANAKRTCSITNATTELSGSETKRYFLSGDYNAQYYNPAITYLPPLKYDGTPYSTSFNAAYTNGFHTSSAQVNLGTSYKPTYGYQPKSSPTHCYAEHPATDTDSGGSKTFTSSTAGVPAYYYHYQTGGGTCTGAGISKTNEDCYVYTAVGASEQQNFANWYSFYRVRNLATVTAATRAFNNLPSTIRLAWQALNSCNSFSSSSCYGWDSSISTDHRIRVLNATGHKENFYKWLERLPANGATPLRAALGRVGEYYSTSSGTNNPYAEDPQVTLGTEHSCRANYTIMMTDGIWNGSAASNSNANGNVDGAAPHPYSDTTSSTLADVAFYYWETDLRQGTNALTNNVPRSPRSLDKLVEDGKTIPTADYNNAENDPANWQHMVTYTVGLGLTSFLSDVGLTWAGDTYEGSYDALVSGDTLWPAAGSDKDENVADLWHAALNGRGLFFSAEDPQTLSDAMQEMVNSIISRTSSAASIATNSRRLDTSTNIYQASFDSGNWTGELEAFAVDSNGVLGASQWTASTKIPASRNIKTFNGSTGVDFAWGNISSAQQTDLGSEDVLNYLRGDQSKEQSKGGAFRNRASLLGDIVNSDPLFVGEENFGYDKLSGAEGTDYVTYLAGKSSKNEAIFVGANDGMLHAFGHSDGTELFAYVPALVYANLPELTKPSYAHKYYVDGAPAVGDVYYGGAAWKTVLVTPLGAGGRGVFALDVTKDFTQTAFAGSDVLWEFNGASSSSSVNDMGYPVGSATIGRFYDGKYYAVFGNGYGSVNCRSGLFMVQVDAPSSVKYFDTGTGACTSNATQNGMSTPSLVDYDGDRMVDAIFAGDLQGNLWKWDVTSATSSVWGLAVGGNPMFAAGKPITAPVEVGRAPADATGQAMVYFGTGRYLLTGDESDTTVQTFYGLLDDGSKITSLTKLQQQTIDYESATARVVSTNPVTWASKQGWYLDLLPPSGTAQGERVLSIPLLRYGRVIFNTSIPSSDPCTLGGTGWLMELDAATGGNLSYSALDMNSDGLFNSGDYVTYTDKGKSVTSAVAGKKSGSMSLNQPTVITGGAKEYKFNSDIKKGISVTTEKSGSSNPRSSWRQLQ
jgi:type IV pilus assembly protein PilY1